MREPWLFWGSLAVVPFAIACFVVAMRVTSERLTRALEIAGEIILGIVLPLAGYEGAYRYPAKDIWEYKAQTTAGGLFIMLGLFCIADVVAKAFNR
jgi:NO-binding membrane sensor protein with MHYT domain